MKIPKILDPARPAVVLVFLTFVAVIFFLAVTQLVQAFQRHETRLARKLFEQGQTEIKLNRPDGAVADFRAALSFSRDNPEYELSLARALRDTGRLDEAESYLQRLWEDRPDDSEVNLALGRLAARRESLPDVLRYYHNAVYGVWLSDADARRQAARLELADFLIRNRDYTPAQSELIVLAPQQPADPDFHVRIAQLFYTAQDYAYALEEFQKVLRLRRGNSVALAGAGRSAFQLGYYRTAVSYLEPAARSSPDSDLESLLETSRLVLQSDPIAPHISDSERARRLLAALETVRQRLTNCSEVVLAGSNNQETQKEVHDLEIRLKVKRVQDLPDLTDQVMQLISAVESQACGVTTTQDRALLLLAQNPIGADR